MMEVIYDAKRWEVLREKRAIAIHIMKALSPVYKDTVAYGSVARGDVTESSDVDIVITSPPNPAIVEALLERASMRPLRREIIMATPSHTPKVYLYLDAEEKTVVSYPISPLKPSEREFYAWGGECDLEKLMRGVRVAGVNKDLMLVMPTQRGHVEVSVVGSEGLVAKTLGISVSTVMERVRVLTRRKEHGRTGVYLKLDLGEMSVEEGIRRFLRKI